VEEMAEGSCVPHWSAWQKTGTWLYSAPETQSVSSSKTHSQHSLITEEWTLVAVATCAQRDTERQRILVHLLKEQTFMSWKLFLHRNSHDRWSKLLLDFHNHR
jgi:hypothetical protein